MTRMAVTMQYTYDAAGLLVHQVRPNNTDFTYDAADRLTSVHTTGPSAAIIGNFDFTLDKVGTEHRWWRPAG